MNGQASKISNFQWSVCRKTAYALQFLQLFYGYFPTENLFYFFTHGKTPFSDYSADSSEVESFFFRDFPEIIL